MALLSSALLCWAHKVSARERSSQASPRPWAQADAATEAPPCRLQGLGGQELLTGALRAFLLAWGRGEREKQRCETSRDWVTANLRTSVGSWPGYRRAWNHDGT